MTSIIDVAQYIVSLEDLNYRVSMQLARLCFFSNCLYYRDYQRRLYSDPCYVGLTAPISPELKQAMAGRFYVTESATGKYHNQLSENQEGAVREAYEKFRNTDGREFCKLCRDYKLASKKCVGREITDSEIARVGNAYWHWNIQYSDFKYLLEHNGWVRQITYPALIKKMLDLKEESQSQFSVYYTDTEWGNDLWELEVKMKLRGGDVLYAMTAGIDTDISNRIIYPVLGRMFGSQPRTHNRRTFDIPLGITADRL